MTTNPESDLEFTDERASIREYGLELVEQGLTAGTGGNLSSRLDDDHIAISPTGVPYSQITPEDVPVVTLDGEVVSGGDPSSELAMHSKLYERRPEIGGVVHTHSPYATTFAVLNEPIPASHYLVAFAGQEVPVAGYESYGTPELGDRAVETLGDDYDACLLKNHGVIAVGDSVGRAFEVAQMVEFCARIHHQALAVGDPEILSEAEIEAVRGRLDDYGRQSFDA